MDIAGSVVNKETKSDDKNWTEVWCRLHSLKKVQNAKNKK